MACSAIHPGASVARISDDRGSSNGKAWGRERVHWQVPGEPDVGIPSDTRPAPPGLSRGGAEMSAIKIAAVVLIAAGILGLVYGKFSYTKETHQANIGSLNLSVKDKETVNVPIWAGAGAIVIGGILLLVPKKS